MAAFTSLVERWTPRRSWRSVSSANQRSTRFSHDPEVGVESGTFRQPVLNQLGLVRSVVVHDEVYVERDGHVLLDRIEEVAELFGTMALLVLADSLAGLGVQRGKQTCRSMSCIVVGAAFDLAGTHGQQARSCPEPGSATSRLRTAPARARVGLRRSSRWLAYRRRRRC